MSTVQEFLLGKHTTFPIYKKQTNGRCVTLINESVFHLNHHLPQPHLTQKELAERLGVTQAYISKIERQVKVTPQLMSSMGAESTAAVWRSSIAILFFSQAFTQ